MSYLESVIEKASHSNILGVGESTHGTHEFFATKAKLFKQLVERNDFNTLMLEDRAKPCQLINEYIRTGRGVLKDLVHSLYPVWQVQEITSLIEWLRNNYDKYPVEFIGFDINQSPNDIESRDKLMADNIRSYVSSHTQAKALIWAHNIHIKLSSEDKQFKPMGMYLKKVFGTDYTAIGQYFGSGEFNATHMDINHLSSEDRTLKPVKSPPPPDEFLENKLGELNKENYYLDKKDFKANGLSETYSARSIGWGLVTYQLDQYIESSNPYSEYDGLIFYQVTTTSNII